MFLTAVCQFSTNKYRYY